MTKCIPLDLTDDSWEETGSEVPGEAPWHRLSGPSIIIMGTPHHMEAWAVTQNAEGELTAISEEWAPEVEALYSIYESALTTTTIRGHEYFVCVFPHGD
jgi:hypothetical protein